MITFTIASTKGGVGKTTLTANLGALLADGAQATEVTLDGRRGLRLRGAAGQVVFERSAQP